MERFGGIMIYTSDDLKQIEVEQANQLAIPKDKETL